MWSYWVSGKHNSQHHNLSLCNDLLSMDEYNRKKKKITWSVLPSPQLNSSFLYDFISVWHNCGGIQRSSSQHWLAWGPTTELLKSGLWAGHSKLFWFFLSHLCLDLMSFLMQDPILTKLKLWNTLYNISIPKYTEKFTINSMTARCAGFMAAKQC